MNLIQNEEIEKLAIEMGYDFLLDTLNWHRLEFVSSASVNNLTLIDQLFEEYSQVEMEICAITMQPNILTYIYVVCEPKKLYDILYKSINLKAFL